MEELRLLVESRTPLVTVETGEEERLAAELSTLTGELGLAFFTWSVTEGVRRHGSSAGATGCPESSAAAAYRRN